MASLLHTFALMSFDTEAPKSFPLWSRVFYSVFLLILIPIYWVKNGPANFLWFSDIALILGGVVIWTRHRLIASAMAVSVVFLELIWNIDFFAQLIIGNEVFGLASYMFDPSEPLVVKILSFLFHVGLPPFFVYCIVKWGYDKRALGLQTLICWVVLPITYAVSPPSQNINWVYGLGGEAQTLLDPYVYLGLLMIAFPLLVYLPSHYFFRWFSKKLHEGVNK